MNYNTRRGFIRNHIRVQPKKRSRPRSGNGLKNFSRFYTMPDHNGQDVSVCKRFFLKTLGFTSDKVITLTLLATPSDVLVPCSDRRGKHEPANKKSAETNNSFTHQVWDSQKAWKLATTNHTSRSRPIAITFHLAHMTNHTSR